MRLTKFFATIDELGRANGVLYLMHRAITLLTKGRGRIVRYHFVAQPIPATEATPQRHSTSTKVEFVNAENSITAHFPRPPAVIKGRFARGDQCLAAIVAERFAGYLWIARGSYDEDEVRCRYVLAAPLTTSWDYDVYVDPDFRIGRTFSRLWGQANLHLRQEGVQWSLSRISAFNSNSLQAHRRLGIQHLFSVTFVCLGSAQLMISGSPPYAHLSFSNRRRPELRLKPAEHVSQFRND